MPDDSSGTYTLPEAPFAPNTVAQSARVNNNFSDIATALTARLAKTALSAFGQTLLNAATAAAARTTLGATATGSAVFTATDAAAARTAIGASTTGSAVVTATDAAAARTAIGATATGSSVLTAADAAAARTAIGAPAAANGALTGTTTAEALNVSGGVSVTNGITAGGLAVTFGTINASFTSTSGPCGIEIGAPAGQTAYLDIKVPGTDDYDMRFQTTGTGGEILGVKNLASAWVSFNGSTQAIRDSYNVSSITRVTTGDYRINFATAMANANYAAQVSATSGPSYLKGADTGGQDPSTTFVRVLTANSGGTATDASHVHVTVHGGR